MDKQNVDVKFWITVQWLSSIMILLHGLEFLFYIFSGHFIALLFYLSTPLLSQKCRNMIYFKKTSEFFINTNLLPHDLLAIVCYTIYLFILILAQELQNHV